MNNKKSYLEVNNHKRGFIFITFALSIFLQCALFSYLCFQTIIISSLWHDTIGFLAYWLPKLAVSLFIASFVWISHKYYWTIFVSALIDIWSIANMIYYRANGFLIVSESFSLVGNLNGFENSISTYLTSSMLLFPLITILYSLICCLSWSKELKWSYCGISLLLSLLSSITGGACLWHSYKRNLATDFFVWQSEHARRDVILPLVGISIAQSREAAYTKENSIISYAYITIAQGIKNKYATKNAEEEIEPFMKQQNIMTSANHTIIEPQHNLVIILIESLESWVIDVVDNNGKEIMPNLKYLSERGIYASKVRSQVRHGVSADGQLTLCTGILPMQSGVAVMRYPNNRYPNYAHLFKQSCVINGSHGVWNQSSATKQYGFKTLYEPQESDLKENTFFKQSWSDEQIVENAISHLTTMEQPYCELLLTLDSHSPFDRVKDNGQLTFDKDMPEVMRRYLTCLHYTDSCIGYLCKNLDFNNTTFVVTGDHTIFKESLLNEMLPYAKKHNLAFADGHNYVPLVIITPKDIQYNIENECYQMDIFPTIMNLIGCEDYYWKGFGVNLLNPSAETNRKITEKEAYKISDLIIRSNYFSSVIGNE